MAARRVAVLGAGLQGACVAMELATDGVAVDLYDRNEICLAGASSHNEGKIHLGYVYANDPTLNTARLMIRGAAAFTPLLRRWIGGDADGLAVTPPYHYAVHEESLLGVEEVERHLEACSAIARQEFASEDYFGQDPRQPPRRLQRYAHLFDTRRIVGAFSTPEIGIDTHELCGRVRARIESDPQIRRLMASTVLEVVMKDRGTEVVFETAGERYREGYDHVVNALWDGRLAVDATVGLQPPRPWLFRRKHFLRGRSHRPASSVPCTTIVLGPFGDVARYDNQHFYLSWYPAGMRGLSGALRPPEWPLVLDEAAAAEVRQATFAALAGLIPSLPDLGRDRIDAAVVAGGVIFAWGATDIDDPGSELHTRSDTGVVSRGRYHSINTGKLTLAPLFGKAAADRVLAA